MGLEVRKDGTHAWAALTGEVTIYTVSEIKAALSRELEGSETIEIDLAGVNEMDTAGLQFMLIAKRYPGKTVHFTNHPPVVLRLVDLANLGGALGDPLLFTAAVES